MAATDDLPPELARLLSAEDDASEEAAWRSFLQDHSRLILHTLHRLGGDQDAVMDRYAYVIEQLRRERHRRLRSYVPSPRSKFTTWLVVVVHRLGLDHHRRRYGSSNESSEAHRNDRQTRRRFVDLVAERVDVENLGSPDGSPDSDIRSSELHRVLGEVLNKLAPRDRLLLKLRFELALPARRIADLMGYPTPFHVYRRCNRLCDELRTELVRHGVEDGEP